MRILSLICACVMLASCDAVVVSGPGPTSTPTRTAPQSPPVTSSGRVNLNTFQAVVRKVEPVAEQLCRNRTKGLNCNFRIEVAADPSLPPNAYQTLDRNGRPVIGFTQALIRDARNADELAFVMGHEAAHHIELHLVSTQQRAVEGALLGTVVATVLGGSAETVEAAQQIGGTVGARRYAKAFELEADALGTVIAHRAGFDPVRGAQYFSRIPDPGNRFLGTHPPNADRIETVRRVAASL